MSHVCLSLGAMTYRACRGQVEKHPFCEIRLDQVPMTVRQVAELFALPQTLIATYRPGNAADRERKALTLAAISAGASYVDLEIESTPSYREPIAAAARRHGCRVILSHHDYSRTPPPARLRQIVRGLYAAGADIAKIACLARSPADAAALLSLYAGKTRPHTLLALAMGEMGLVTRLAAPLLGAPFTYASPGEGKATAPGQLEWRRMESLLAQLESRQ